MKRLSDVRPASDLQLDHRSDGPTPPWIVWALIGVVGVSIALGLVNAASAGYSDFYATAAKSMSVSWRAFFFGAFDPRSTITLDKLSGFLVPQALSARLFGFSAFSLALPQVAEGAVTILTTYLVVRRWIGAPGGLLAAVFTASTPVFVSTFSHPMEDGLLTMSTTVAVAAWQRYIDSDRTRYLVITVIAIGLGFQAKMLQAWLVVPAMALVYLLAAFRSRAAKVRILLIAGLATVTASISWMTAIALVPPAQRPYIDGTTDNNIFTMVFGYNGVNRFFNNAFAGALKSAPPAKGFGAPLGVGLIPGPIGHTPFKFLVPEYASQAGWLFPLAGAGILLGAISLGGRRFRDPSDHGLRVGTVFCGALLATLLGVLGAMSLPHTAYLASLILPLAFFSAVGVVRLWQTFQNATSLLRFALPATVLAQTLWTLYLLTRFPHFAPWVRIPVSLLGLGAACALTIVAVRRTSSGRISRACAVAALIATLICPFAWSLSTIVPAYGGTSNDAYAGPAVQRALSQVTARERTYGIGLDSNRVVPATARIEEQIYDYAKLRSADEKYALLTDSWRSAAPLIMQGARRVLPVGGFTSRVASPDRAQLADLVRDRKVSFVVLTHVGSKNGVVNPNVAAIQKWVGAYCSLVPQQAYLSSIDGEAAAGTAVSADDLYHCSS